MNFYGHLVLGHRRSPAPAFLLGTMLPDFASMAGLGRVSAPEHRELSSGIDFHHRTDAVFHRAPVFVEMVAAGIDALVGQGVGRGPARAVAHVGIELLLDGLLFQDPRGPGADAYKAALATGLTPEVAQGVFASPRRQTTRTAGEGHRADSGALQALLKRLSAAPVPERYIEPRFVAERLQSILAPRPRLALPADAEPTVVDWLAGAKTTLTHGYDELLGQVTDGLDASSVGSP